MKPLINTPRHQIRATFHAHGLEMTGTDYENNVPFLPPSMRNRTAIRVPNSSELHLKADVPIELCACLDASCKTWYRSDNCLCSVDGNCMDSLSGAWDVTRPLVLLPGEHRLRIDTTDDSGCRDLVWLICRADREELATLENTAFLSTGAFGNRFNDATEVYRNSALRCGIPLVFVDQEEEFVSFYRHKITGMRDELLHQQQLGKRYAFIMDARDIVFLHSVEIILAKFNAMYDGKTIFNADLSGESWPVCRDWFLQSMQKAGDHPAANLNSGFIVGEIGRILAIMEQIKHYRREFSLGRFPNDIVRRVHEEHGFNLFEDDQFWYSMVMVGHPELFMTDREKRLVAFIRDFPKKAPSFDDDPRQCDSIGKASVVHGSRPAWQTRWKSWAERIQKTRMILNSKQNTDDVKGVSHD